MMVNLPSITILGSGSMGGAILSGLLQPGVSVDGGIRVTNRTPEKADALAADGVTSYSLERDPDANLTAVAGARIVLIGVKPHMVPDLLRSIAGSLEPDAIVVSVAAGVPIAAMEALVPGTVIRAMPNTPAIVGLAVTGLSAGVRATADDMALARALFETVGQVLEVPEEKIDALSTISGSGPAYVFYLIEQLTHTAIDLGFSSEEAAVMVNGTFRGASELLAASAADGGANGGADGEANGEAAVDVAAQVSPSELRRRVTSPGGTTERAVAELEAADFKATFDRATAAALARARELAKG
jgi:pyrroline-5-carboxylate reductase